MSGDKLDCNVCLATAGDYLKLWTSRGYTLSRQWNPHHGSVHSLKWSHDNNILASASAGSQELLCLTYINANNHTVSVENSNGVPCAAFSSDSRLLAGGNCNGVVVVWETKTGRLRRTFDQPSHAGIVTSVEFGFRDAMIASGSNCGDVILYNTASGQGFSPLQTPNKQAIRQLQFSRFRRALLGAACDDGSLYLWDTNTKMQLRRFDAAAGAHHAPCTGLVFSPCNQMLLVSVGLDKSIICYDVTTNKVIKNMSNEEPLTCIDLLDDGCTLAVGTTRGQVHVYDIRQSTKPVHSFLAHSTAVNRLCFQSNAATSKKSGSSSSNHTSSKSVENNNVTPATKQPALVTSNQDRPGVGAVRALNNNNDLFSPPRDETFSPPHEANTYSISSTVSSEPISSTAAGHVPIPSRASIERPGVDSSMNFADGIFSPVASVTTANERSPMETAETVFYSPLNAVGSSAARSVGLPASSSIAAGITPKTDLTSSSKNAILSSYGNQHRIEIDQEQLVRRTMNGVSSRLSASLSDLTGRDQRFSPLVSNMQSSYYRPPDQGVSMSSNLLLHQSPSLSANSAARLLPNSSSYLTAASASPQAKDPVSISRQPCADLSVPIASNIGLASDSSRQTTLEPDCCTTNTSSANVHGASEDNNSSAAFHPYLIELVRNTVREEVEECYERMHQTVTRLHADMLKMFCMQQMQMEALVKAHSVNPELVAEIDRLKKEIERLSKNY